jgi:hypothetical protein
MVQTTQTPQKANDFYRSALANLLESKEDIVKTATKEDKAEHGDKDNHGNDDHGNNGGGHDAKTVTIIVNSTPKTLPKGKHLVSDLKRLVGIPADYEMDQMIHGVFTSLPDTDEIHIKDGDQFIGHVRTGGSS